MAFPIPDGVRELLEAPNYVHLSTLRADGSPRNSVVWVGLEGEHIRFVIAVEKAAQHTLAFTHNPARP